MLFFSREATSENYGPRLFLNIFAFAFYFPLLLFSDLLNKKYKNTLLQFILIYLVWCSIYQSTTILSRQLDNFWHRYPKGIDNPFNTSGSEVLLFECRGCLRCVAWFSYWFNNLGFIYEGNTYATVLHHPFLFGEILT